MTDNFIGAKGFDIGSTDYQVITFQSEALLRMQQVSEIIVVVK